MFLNKLQLDIEPNNVGLIPLPELRRWIAERRGFEVEWKGKDYILSQTGTPRSVTIYPDRDKITNGEDAWAYFLRNDHIIPNWPEDRAAAADLLQSLPSRSTVSWDGFLRQFTVTVPANEINREEIIIRHSGFAIALCRAYVLFKVAWEALEQRSW